jgi:hypothetical protein
MKKRKTKKKLLPPRMPRLGSGSRNRGGPIVINTLIPRNEIIRNSMIKAAPSMDALRKAGWSPSNVPLRTWRVSQYFRVQPKPTQEEEAEKETVSLIGKCVFTYLQYCRHSVKPKQFRRDLAKFSKALSSFIPKIPEDGSAVAQAINKIVAEEVRSEDPGQIEEPVLRQGSFMKAESNRVRDDCWLEDVAKSLRSVLTATKAIQAAEAGRGSDGNRAAHQLVADLAAIFEQTTGKRASRVNVQDFEITDTRVGGLFGEFVDSVNAQIPQEYRLNDIDNLIRSLVTTRHRVTG